MMSDHEDSHDPFGSDLSDTPEVAATGERAFIFIGVALIAGLALFAVFGLGNSEEEPSGDLETAAPAVEQGDNFVSATSSEAEEGETPNEPSEDVPDELAFNDPEDGTVEEAAIFEGSVEEDGLEGLPPLASLPMRGAYFRDDTLFLEGPVESQEEADEFFAAAAAVVGEENIVNNYIIRPDAPEAEDRTVQVEQAVEFESGSAVINEEYFPILELAVAVMELNPRADLVIQGHTDNVGDEADNLALSQARADSVVEYLVGRGVEADRLDPIGFGQSEPVADNSTAEGRFLNRRIEFDIVDLLSTE